MNPNKVKFRVYSSKAKQIVDVDRLVWDANNIAVPVKGHSYLLYSDDDKLLAYTGFKTIGGTEIYEGDIVLTEYGPAEVYWNEAAGQSRRSCSGIIWLGIVERSNW